jgi:hypothetical protein
MSMTHYADTDGKYLGSFDETSEKPKGVIVPPPPDGRAIWTGKYWNMDDVLMVEQQANRQAAYTAEADPLFFKWQAGEATEADWKAKRQEIRDRFPYPEDQA